MAMVDLVSSAEDQQQEPIVAKQRASVDDHSIRRDCLKQGVRHLSDCGITRLPHSYVLPPSDRPVSSCTTDHGLSSSRVKLPVIDLARLRDLGERASVLETIDAACRDYGFFQVRTMELTSPSAIDDDCLEQVVNHGVASEVTAGVLDVARRFFELPFAERARYMTPDVRTAVRYGTSFNQANDDVLCWRDFLKLVCHAAAVQSWPREPADLREAASRYAMASHALFMELTKALLQALGIPATAGGGGLLADGSTSQMMTINCYPACPQPELTLGMPPHSDYGLLTLVLQDKVEGLQVMHRGRWLTVDPVPGSVVVNVGDHLEIYSNGRYKSVLHRVVVNSRQLRMSVASFHSVPAERTIGPAPELVNDDLNPRRYMDTDFATFLAYLASAEGKHKTFLQSRKLPPPAPATADAHAHVVSPTS